ncbi:MAG: 50S ribosomal protein L5 [Phycisphaeraceae bacterium]|nr:50S ribosomal protein L5 [Phycisphaeraceae bacterium]
MAKTKGTHKGAATEADTGPAQPPRLRELYKSTVREAAMKEFGIDNPMALPEVDKVVINVNMGRHLDGIKLPAHVRAQVLETLTVISGQKPVVVKAKKSVANFKVREGSETAAMVTLRRDRMWHFLDRYINLAVPRIKDFRGVPDKAFDKGGNYAMGVTEQAVFPEVDMAKANFTHGMNINICFKNSDPKKSRFILEQLGMPFRKPDERR